MTNMTTDQILAAYEELFEQLGSTEIRPLLHELAVARKVVQAAAAQDAADIVTRLRAGEACRDDPCRVKEAASGCLCATAADKIERLR